MAQPWKGPRRGFQIRWTEDDRRLVKSKAEAAGMTMNDYLIELARRDEVDDCGRPLWAAGAVASEEALPGLEMSA
ncbi:MAG TPA: hypothetical protein VNT60_08220 [Deinococcales bacterium]|nr:hypothetical protein [Deinococcales bacterium]